MAEISSGQGAGRMPGANGALRLEQNGYAARLPCMLDGSIKSYILDGLRERRHLP
jgi:hypothetical protein